MSRWHALARAAGVRAKRHWSPQRIRRAIAGASAPAIEYIVLPAYASIATFGDSITQGYNSTDFNTKPWAALTAAHVGATLLNQGIAGTVLQNTGNLGNNGRNRFKAALTGANLKAAVFINYGHNDASLDTRRTATPAGTLTPAQFIVDAREVLNGLLLLGYARETIYWPTPYYVTDANLAISGITRAIYEEYVAGVLQVAGEFGIRTCNLYERLNAPAYIADVTSTDHVHPTDVGHALIFAAMRDYSYIANTQAAPASVAVSGGAGSVTVTPDAVTGAVSYEYALVAPDGHTLSFSDVRTATTTAVEASAGSYHGKARAVFADGTKGPWTLSAGTATATAKATSGVFFDHSFSGPTGEVITAVWPEFGGIWKLQDGETATTFPPRMNSAGEYYPVVGSSATAAWRNEVDPPSADYEVEADFVFRSQLANNLVGLAGRMQVGAKTYYAGYYSEFSGNWGIIKRVAGAAGVAVGSAYNSPFRSAGTRKVKLRMQGTTIQLFVDDMVTPKISGTDSAISLAGYGGTYQTMAQGESTGLHITRIVGRTL